MPYTAATPATSASHLSVPATPMGGEVFVQAHPVQQPHILIEAHQQQVHKLLRRPIGQHFWQFYNPAI